MEKYKKIIKINLVFPLNSNVNLVTIIFCFRQVYDRFYYAMLILQRSHENIYCNILYITGDGS